MTKAEAAERVIERVARGIRPDQAMRRLGGDDRFSNYTLRQFFATLRKHPELNEEFDQALEDWARMEAIAIVSMSDELEFCSDPVEIQAMRERIKTRQWMAERLVKQFQPSIKNEHSGKLTLTVTTGVPRMPEQIQDAEHRVLPSQDSIEDIL